MFCKYCGSKLGTETKNIPVSLDCPYCKKRTDIDLVDGEKEYKCKLCNKEFKCITGVISKTRGRINALVRYGAEPISITFKNDISINFFASYQFLVSRGDRVSFIYIKGLIFTSYKDNPKSILNLTTKQQELIN